MVPLSARDGKVTVSVSVETNLFNAKRPHFSLFFLGYSLLDIRVLSHVWFYGKF